MNATFYYSLQKVVETEEDPLDTDIDSENKTEANDNQASTCVACEPSATEIESDEEESEANNVNWTYASIEESKESKSNNDEHSNEFFNNEIRY